MNMIAHLRKEYEKEKVKREEKNKTCDILKNFVFYYYDGIRFFDFDDFKLRRL